MHHYKSDTPVQIRHLSWIKLSKEIMTRSPLRNKFLKTKTDENKKAYNNQRNYCASLFCREKNSIFNNLDIKKAVDNKCF